MFLNERSANEFALDDPRNNKSPKQKPVGNTNDGQWCETTKNWLIIIFRTYIILSITGTEAGYAICMKYPSVIDVIETMPEAKWTRAD